MGSFFKKNRRELHNHLKTAKPIQNKPEYVSNHNPGFDFENELKQISKTYFDVLGLELDKEIDEIIRCNQSFILGELKEAEYKDSLEQRLESILNRIQTDGLPGDVIVLFEKLDECGIVRREQLEFYVRKYDIYFRQGGWI